MTFELEDDVPVPSSGRYKTKSYPFSTMEIGQSFLLNQSDAQHARMAAAQYKLRHPGWKYASRQVEQGVVRLWRIA